MSSRDEAVDWAIRLDAAEIPEADRRAFEIWLARDPAHAALYRQAEAVLAAAPQAFALVRRPRPARARRPLAVPAGLLAAALALFVALDGPMRLRADTVSGPGEIPTLTLPDGSRVQLDGSSAIAVSFDSRQRRVRLLRGEAFFQVAADAERPFTVEAAGGGTTALGTAFDVRLTGGGAEVTVAEHAVSVTAATQSTTLSEGQQVAYAEGRLGTVRSLDPAAAAAWRSGRLVIENETLASVVERIGRHSRTPILVLGELAERRISGSFDIRDPMSAIAMLERSLHLRATRIGGLMIVLRG